MPTERGPSREEIGPLARGFTTRRHVTVSPFRLWRADFLRENPEAPTLARLRVIALVWLEHRRVGSGRLTRRQTDGALFACRTVEAIAKSCPSAPRRWRFSTPNKSCVVCDVSF